MPWGLKRFQQSRQLHFLTFSCYHRQPKFGTSTSRATFESALEQVRQKYDLCIYGYVVMPEHVHMLVNEPERLTLAQAMQSLKQSVARRLALRARSVLAGPLLRLQRLERVQVRRETPLHPPESSGARISSTTRRLGVEQFPSLPDRRTGPGGDRVTMDRAKKGTSRNLSDSASASASRKPPPKQSLDGPPTGKAVGRKQRLRLVCRYASTAMLSPHV